jgi:hypothetical protein
MSDLPTKTFDELMAHCPNVTLDQLQFWRDELDKDGYPHPEIDKAIVAFRCAELEEGCSVTAGSDQAFYAKLSGDGQRL